MVSVFLSKLWKLLHIFKTPAISEVNTVLFFPDKTVPCYKFLFSAEGCPRKHCKYSHDLTQPYCRLLGVVFDARSTIDICIFSFTDMKLYSAVILKHQQGTRVRIITDQQYMNLTGSQIFKLVENGVEVRYNKQDNLMHHKFAIIDQKLIMTGSFNWTQAAVESNNENILITSNKEISLQYTVEFEMLWKNFEPEACKSNIN